jgi:hypothetical protein
MDKDNPVPCIICGKELSHAFGRFLDEPEITNQPNDGVACVSYGNYGSTVFDSFDGQRIEFAICDICLVERWERVRITHWHRQRPKMEVVVTRVDHITYLQQRYAKNIASQPNSNTIDPREYAAEADAAYADLSNQRHQHVMQHREPLMSEDDQHNLIHGTEY